MDGPRRTRAARSLHEEGLGGPRQESIASSTAPVTPSVILIAAGLLLVPGDAIGSIGFAVW